MKRIVAGFIVAVDRDALETIDGPSFRNEDRDQTETDDPEESGIHLWPSVERFSPDVRSPGCRQLLNARGLESSSSRIVMSDRRKKPMSRDQRLPRRESNLTEKSIYRENPRDIVVFLDHATCPRPTLDDQVCFVGGYQGDDFQRRRSALLFRLYFTPIDDFPLGKNSSFSFVFLSSSLFCRI